MQQKIEEGKYVAFSYKVYNDEDNRLLFETPADHPDVLIYGISHDVIPGLLVAIKGLKAGDKFSVTLPAQAAFGERFADNVVMLDKSLFMRDGQLAEAVKVGAELPMMTEQGMVIKGRVLDITDDKVEMDFNHPFAGLTVKFEGEINEVRDATPEEIQALSHQGCGCGHCGDDCGCDDCGCGDDHGCTDGCCH